MDKNSTIIGAVLLALCAIPFVLTYLSRRKKEKQMLSDLSSLAAEYNCKIDQYEICRDFIIGLDGKKEFVFFDKKAQNQHFRSTVKLSDVQNCKMYRINRTVGEKSTSQTIIERLELRFQPKTKNGKETSWLIYDVDENMQISGELAIIEKWCKIIDDQLSKARRIV